MIFLSMLGGLLVVLLVVWRKRRKRINQLAVSPLAGRDTGVRSAYRTPNRFFHNRRTL